MRLTYLTTGEQPNRSIKELFEKTSIIEIEPKDLFLKIGPVEKQMREAGSVAYDFKDFVLCTLDLYDNSLGATVGRNRFNFGVVGQNDSLVRVGDRQVIPKVMFGDTPVRITKASKLPFKEKEQRILCVSPHYEEEATLFPAALHKSNNDKVYVSVVTPVPVTKEKSNLEKITCDVYENVFGLEPKDYSFMGIPDRHVRGHEKEFKEKFEKLLADFSPSTVITTTWGANFDHNAVGEFIYDVIKDNGINMLYGNVLQNTEFRPALFPIVDESCRKKLVDTFADDKIGEGPDHPPTIDNLFSPLPESINRYVGILKEKEKIPTQERIGVYALQPIILNAASYNIPQSGTRILSL